MKKLAALHFVLIEKSIEYFDGILENLFFSINEELF